MINRNLMHLVIASCLTIAMSGCASGTGGAGAAGRVAGGSIPAAGDPTVPTMPMAAAHMMESPGLALAHWDELGLSVDQLRRLEDLQVRAHAEQAALMADLAAAQDELTAATQSPPDEVRARAALERLSELRIEASLATLRTREATIALLTPSQVEQLAALAHEHAHLMMMGSGVCDDALVADATGMVMPCPMSHEMPRMDGSQDSSGADAPAPHIH